jgi:hypothetical protein
MPSTAAIIQTVVQVITAGIIGWLVHKLGQARTEFRSFMREHEFLLQSARETSHALVLLNRRLDRLQKRIGKAV